MASGEASRRLTGEFVSVLPVFGEPFGARVMLGQHPGRFR
jgi:hypothetical protein